MNPHTSFSRNNIVGIGDECGMREQKDNHHKYDAPSVSAVWPGLERERPRKREREKQEIGEREGGLERERGRCKKW